MVARARQNLRPGGRRVYLACSVLAVVIVAVTLAGWSRQQRAYAAGTGGIAVFPSTQQVQVGGPPFGVDILASSVAPTGSFDFQIQYQPSVVSFFGIAVGPFLSSTGRAIFCPPPMVDSIAGTVRFSCASSGLTPPGASGSGRLATVAFTPAGTGTSPLTFLNRTNAPYSDESGDPFTSFSFADGSVQVIANNGTPLATATGTLTPTITPTSTQSVPPTPTPTGIAPPGACGPQVAIAVCPTPAAIGGSVGAPLAVDVRVEDVANFGSFSVTLEYSNTMFPTTPTFSQGPFLASSGRPVSCVGPTSGTGSAPSLSQVRENCVTLGPPPPTGLAGAAGSGTIGTFTFMPAAQGTGIISIPAASILDVYGAVDPSGRSDTTTVTVGPFVTPTPCAGACPTSTPTITPFPADTSTVVPTATATRTATRTSTPCSGACPTVAPTNTPSPTPTAGPATVRIAPLTQSIQTGELAVFGVYVDGTVNLGSFSIQVAFDPLVLQRYDVQGCLTGGACQPSPFLLESGRHQTCFVTGIGDPNATPAANPGVIGFNCVTLDPADVPGATGSGLLATISLRAVAPAASTALHLQGVQLLTTDVRQLPVGATIDGAVTITLAATPTPCGGVCPTNTAVPTATPTATVVPGSVANTRISPQQQTVGVNQDVEIDLNIANVANLGTFEFKLKYDTQSLAFVSAVDAGFIDSTGRATFCPTGFSDSGVVSFGCASTGASPPGPGGAGTLARVRFHTLQQAVVDLQLQRVELGDPLSNTIASSITDTADEIIILNSSSTPTATPTRTATPGPSPTPSNQQACVTQPGGTGVTCLVIDADPSTPGQQNARQLPASGSFTVDIVARGVPSANDGLGFFNATVLYDPLLLSAATPTSGLVATNGFNCANANGRLPEGDNFADGNPATGDAFINCFNPAANQGPSGDLVIASIPFTILGTGTTTLRFFSSSISDGVGGNLASCNPIDLQPGAGCLDGLVFNGAPPPPAPTQTSVSTPTATSTSAAPATSPTPPQSVGGISLPPDLAALPAQPAQSHTALALLAAAFALLLLAGAAWAIRLRADRL